MRSRARGLRVELLREPGGVAVSERIRALVKDPALAVAPATEALLYAAARAQLVEERLQPLLREGAIVLLDRFVDSSLAYQGAGRALGVERGARDQPLRHRRADTGPHAAAAHLPRRGTRAPARRAPWSPIGSSARATRFFAAIAAAYDELARAEPSASARIDADRSRPSGCSPRRSPHSPISHRRRPLPARPLALTKR